MAEKRLWEECLAGLSADERARADEFRFDGPRRRFVLSRSALRKLLGQYLGERPETIRFSIVPGGKPQLAGESAATALRFNLSHSGDLALVVVARRADVGVDVEQVRAVSHLEQIAKRYFHADEVEEVLTAPAADRNLAFLRCWTAKEAVLKAMGMGISGRLDRFRVPISEHEPSWVDMRLVQASDVNRCWLQQLKPCAQYVAAMACLDVERRARCYTYSPWR
jgi:4'-phosphopantetheinyl transferase